MTRTVWTRCAGAALIAALAGTAQAQRRAPLPGRVAREAPVVVATIPVLRVGPGGRPLHNEPSPLDACNVVASLTDANFEGGSFVAQAGFSQGEMAAATYTVAATEFPIRINLAEMIFVTSGATTSTTTQWSILFYSGVPTTGTLVDSFSSDDLILPHIHMGPGTNGVNVQFSVDSADPEQVIIPAPADGSHSFTVAFRIDHHNQPPGNPCSQGADTCCNAFPCTDVGGLQNPTMNWLNGLNCGAFGCPGNGGWARFSNLVAGLCRPSGDWVMRATWSGVNCTPGVGACCKPDGTCLSLTVSDCATAGGVYRGDGVACAAANCPQPSAACCFSNGSCLTQPSAGCAQLGGTWLGLGVSCNGSSCPTTGGCCLPTGSCVTSVTSAQCVAQHGVFRGLGTTCAGANCPDLRGACCTNGGANCGQLLEADCLTIGGAWNGAGSTCAASCTPPTGACCTNAGANCGPLTQANCATIGGVWLGVNSSCASCAQACYANCDHSTISPVLNVQDFSCFLNRFAAGDTTANCDQSTTAPVLNVQDFSCFLNRFATGCS